MADEDSGPEEEEPLGRTTSIGLSLKVPAKASTSDREAPPVNGSLTLLLHFQGQEWSTEVEVDKTIEYVKALALERFGALRLHKNL